MKTKYKSIQDFLDVAYHNNVGTYSLIRRLLKYRAKKYKYIVTKYDWWDEKEKFFGMYTSKKSLPSLEPVMEVYKI